MAGINQNTHQLKMSIYIPRLLATIFQYAWLVVTCVTVLAPFLWMVMAAFTNGKLLNSVDIFRFTEKFSFEHFNYLFTYIGSTVKGTGYHPSDFMAAFFRTLTIAGVQTVGIVIINAFTGYIFARFRFAGKKTLLIGFLILQLFPGFMGMLALFQMFRIFPFLGLNNPMALAFLGIAGSVPYNTYLVRGYMRTIGKSIDEAATIDGASKMTIFWKIILPLSTPILGFISITAFMGPWLDYMFPKQVLDNQHTTVAVFLFRLTDSYDTLFYNPLTFMAGGLLIGIPITAIMFYTQRFIVYGMTSGAEKG